MTRAELNKEVYRVMQLLTNCLMEHEVDVRIGCLAMMEILDGVSKEAGIKPSDIAPGEFIHE